MFGSVSIYLFIGSHGPKITPLCSHITSVLTLNHMLSDKTALYANTKREYSVDSTAVIALSFKISFSLHSFYISNNFSLLLSFAIFCCCFVSELARHFPLYFFFLHFFLKFFLSAFFHTIQISFLLSFLFAWTNIVTFCLAILTPPLPSQFRVYISQFSHNSELKSHNSEFISHNSELKSHNSEFISHNSDTIQS